MQFMLEPIKLIVKGYVHFFGVSGYSGAGSKPSPRNDKQLLKNNILPYSLVKHTHELEVRHNCYEKIFFLLLMFQNFLERYFNNWELYIERVTVSGKTD